MTHLDPMLFRLRLVALTFLLGLPAGPALAARDSAEVAQLRLYVQQLEQRVRELTGINEQLTFEVNQLRAAQAGAAPGGVAASGQMAPGFGQSTGAFQPLPGAGNQVATSAEPLEPGIPPAGSPELGTPPQDLGTLSIARDDPSIVPDGVPADADGAPLDLSELAARSAPDAIAGSGMSGGSFQPDAGGQDVASLSGSSRDEYDLAYGYVLTGDYDLAEKSFTRWLAAFPDDPQAMDARFWLGESQYAQKNYRAAANSYLALYKESPGSAKAPDALFKLGVSLSALGEKAAACATLLEVGKRYPQVSAALKTRVSTEAGRAGCG